MKANEAPERIWIDPATDLPKLSGHIDKNSVEYIRKDVFIEKAVEWLKSHSENDYVESHMGVTIMHKDKFIKNFKNYMNEEE
jgi:hypothetical protein